MLRYYGSYFNNQFVNFFCKVEIDVVGYYVMKSSFKSMVFKLETIKVEIEFRLYGTEFRLT